MLPSIFGVLLASKFEGLTSSNFLRRNRRIVFIVSLDDFRDDAGSNNIIPREMNVCHFRDEGNPSNCIGQAGTSCDVDLRRITIDDDFCVQPNAGQEHFHLLRGGVLRFIKNDKGFFESSATEIPQRDGFNDLVLQKVRRDV